MLALVMAGGQGTGLGELSKRRAKPAVPIAGQYRLVDFALSNLTNSGLHRVRILAQYRPHSLVRHIGDGEPWDLHRLPPNGAQIWQPYQGPGELSGYRGTADALHQNSQLISAEGMDLLLIICGDHVYRQDYRDMLRFHCEQRADLTIAVTQVRPTDVHRFGIATVEEDARITAFVEKPEEADGNLASMGIYIANTDFLLRRLDEDARDPSSAHEIGRSVIPGVVDSHSVFAYRFGGPWIDVGTVPTYWETNLALLTPRPPVNLYDRTWPIRTRADQQPPARYGRSAQIRESMVSPGCLIEGRVIRSVLSPGVRVEPGATVRDSVLLHDVHIESGAIVDGSVLDERVEVGARARLGMAPDDLQDDRSAQHPLRGATLVGMDARIPPDAVVGRNCVVEVDVTERDFERLDVPIGATVRRR
ncbi:MAG: glucose-1-phosphate adenylyltransferase [Planctomycetes bacterium]|nr:glucose-1-phosphate adenylyltransferase [Planctomycetota bacterium]